MSNRLPAIILVLLGTFVLMISIANAQVANMPAIQQEAVGLTAIPPRLGDDGSLRADPGETIQAQVRVRNTTNQPLMVSTLVEDFIIDSDGRTPIPVVGQTDSRWSLAQWMELPLRDQVIPAGASQTIPVIIRVPETALPGGRYAMIMHQPKSESQAVGAKGETAGQTGIQQRVGTLVYFRVNGDVREEAFIRNVRVPMFQEFGPVKIAFDVENLSDMHIQPVGSVVIKDMLGREKDKIDVESQNVFPQTLREFSAQWDRVWGLGRYTAEISLTYGEKGQTALALAHFWVVPVKLLLAIGVAILALIGVGVAIRRHSLQRNSVESQHISLLEDRIHELENELHNRKE